MNPRKEYPGNKIAHDHDKLLKLIEEGDPATILSEENISKGFNELMNHGLIVLEEGKIHLTALGEEAKRDGVKAVLLREQLKAAAVEPQAVAPLPKTGIKNRRRNLWLLILISIFILLTWATINVLRQ